MTSYFDSEFWFISIPVSLILFYPLIYSLMKRIFISSDGAGKTVDTASAAKMSCEIVLGMPLDRWECGSCVAHFGTGDDWATLYDIESSEKGKGDASNLLLAAKRHYEGEGKKVGGTVALNPTMKHLYDKLGFLEYA